MNLRYCVNCQETFICDAQPCPLCGKKLYYFGRERVSLSPLKILAEYDKLHPYQPLVDYKGVYFIDRFTPELDSSILECEDVLKHKADEPNALFFLGMTYFSKREFVKAKGFLKRLIELNPADDRPYRRLADIYIHDKESEKAIELLNYVAQKQPSDWEIRDILGREFLKIGDSKKALTAFVMAYKLCNDSEKKVALKLVLKQVTTLLEEGKV